MDIDITQLTEIVGGLLALAAAGIGVQKGSARWNAAKELVSDIADFVARAYQVPELKSKAQEIWTDIGEFSPTFKAILCMKSSLAELWDREGRSEKSPSFRLGMRAKPFANVTAIGSILPHLNQ